MGSTIEHLDLGEQARSAAARASERAGVEITELENLEAFGEASRLYASVWSETDEGSLMPRGMLRAFAHTGNYVAGAYADGRLIGALAGFFGGGPADAYLHSHILGVSPQAQGRNVGYALKQHQRAWSVQRGIPRITWTFDPLVSRNAYFNLTKLGAGAGAYYSNFYQRMNDGINAGEESDRLLVEWILDSPRAIAASDGGPAGDPDPPGTHEEGTVVALDEDDRGRPVTRSSHGARVLLLRVPTDIIAVRAASLDIARAWRAAQRRVLGDAIAEGYRVDRVTKSGWYVLEREPGGSIGGRSGR